MLRKNQGFTLIELMLVLGIMAVLGAVAIPSYRGYIKTARVSAVQGSVESLRIFLEDYNMTNGNYVAAADVATIYSKYGWKPKDSSSHPYTYAVAEGSCGAACYKVSVVADGYTFVYDSENGWDMPDGY